MLFRILLLTGMGLCFFSCEKMKDSDYDSQVTGRYFDQELKGAWTRYYSARDINNGITRWTDSIRFAENNRGTQQIYRFSVLEQEISFLYYTDEDSLFLIRKKNTEKWIYTVKNDSLFLMTPQPGYSSYCMFLNYRKVK